VHLRSDEHDTSDRTTHVGRFASARTFRTDKCVGLTKHNFDGGGLDQITCIGHEEVDRTPACYVPCGVTT